MCQTLFKTGGTHRESDRQSFLPSFTLPASRLSKGGQQDTKQPSKMRDYIHGTVTAFKSYEGGNRKGLVVEIPRRSSVRWCGGEGFHRKALAKEIGRRQPEGEEAS